MIKKVLTIAGSDSSGGAGLQADLKTFEEYGVFGFTAITCLVTMDPDKNWSHTVTSIDEELVAKQLKTIFTGGNLDAVKIGMTGSIENIQVIATSLKQHQQKQIILDPVMACKGTSELLQPDNVAMMKKLLLPQAMITTPNLIEAGILSEMGELTTIEDVKNAAKKITTLGPQYVVIKGGHRLAAEKEAVDVFYDGHEFTIFKQPKISSDYNHGAGCTFAAAVTAGVAKGYPIVKAVQLAKNFVYASIKHGIKINPYLGHVWHGAYNQAENRMPLN